MESLQEGQLYFDRVSGRSHEEKLAFFRSDHDADNFMMGFECFSLSCVTAGVLPWCDICCDRFGANSLCPYFLSAHEDATT